MDAIISEPFLLSSYGLSHRLTKSGATGNGYKAPNVYATHSEFGSNSSDGYVTVTAQGDGVHVLDLSTLHPLISHTLGPSTTFACPAVTRNTLKGAENACTTYAVIASSPDIVPEESGRTLWMWTEDMSSSLADRTSQKKKSGVVPHLASQLFVSEDLPSGLLVLSPKGEVTMTDAEVNVQHTRTSPREGCPLLKSFVFSRKSCSFLPSRSAPPRGVIVILLHVNGETIQVQNLAISEEEGFVELGDCQIQLKADQIMGISCSTSGYLSALMQDGTWHSFQLESTNGTSVDVSPVAEPIHLTSFSFISSSSPNNFVDELSLLSLGSSHVLLAGITKTPAREIILLLWDLQYAVLLASHTLPVPSTVSQSKEITIKLDLNPAHASQALLVLSPNVSTSGRKSQASSSLRSSVLVVPFTVPTTSTIANAMGRAASGEKWLVQADPSSSALSHQSEISPARRKVLEAMRSAMQQNLPQAANDSFFEWEKREKDAVENTKCEPQSAESSHTGEEHPDSQPTLAYSFVTALLAIVLQPTRPANTPYSSEVLRYLLGRQVVSNNMVERGLLETLRLRSDWRSIQLALDNVLDIPEADVVSALQCVVNHHRQSKAAASGDVNAMQIDSTTAETPSLPAFLSSCVCYSTSPTALRLAIRERLQDAADVLCVLDVLEGWMAKWSVKDLHLLPSAKSISKTEHGVLIVNQNEKDDERELPPLIKVLSFLQTLLDASFLTLLQHTPSHRTLRKIFSHVDPEISFIDQLEHLRGPLEPFAKAQAKAIKEGREGKRTEPQVNWRQKKKQAHEQAGLSIGLYRLEELVL